MIVLLGQLIASYLAGSIPTSILIGRLTRNIDIRDYGSGNAGGTNVFRVMGWKPALVVAMVDVFKGWFAAAVISSWTFQDIQPSVNPGGMDPILVAILCGFAAVIGHTYTVFAGFRGGKGVGTLAGMLIHLFPVAVPIGMVVWGLILILTGIVSLGSIVAVSLFPLITYLKYGTLNSVIGYFSIIVVGFIWYTHRSNIRRLLTGTENRFEKAMILHRRSNAA